jgi:hypothetical protein
VFEFQISNLLNNTAAEWLTESWTAWLAGGDHQTNVKQISFCWLCQRRWSNTSIDWWSFFCIVSFRGKTCGKGKSFICDLCQHTPKHNINPFTAEVAIMRLLGSAPVAFVRPEKEEQSDWFVWPNDSFYWHRVFILQTDARAFDVFKNTLNWLKIDSVDQKFNWLECGNFSQHAGMPGTESVIAFSQLAVKGLTSGSSGWSHNTDTSEPVVGVSEN